MMDDLISRQAAIKAVHEEFDECLVWDESGEYTADEVERILDRVPSTQSEVLACGEGELNTQGWIPCGERLPEDYAEVIVTWINTNPEPYYDFIKGKTFVGMAVYYKNRWFWYSPTCVDWLREYGHNPNDEMDYEIKVIAWMPLPKPYRGGEKDE